MSLVDFLIYPVAISPVSECIIELNLLDSMQTPCTDFMTFAVRAWESLN